MTTECQREAMEYGYYAPEIFWTLTDDQLSDMAYRCGPGRVLGWIFPDFGFTCPCQIHDVDYATGTLQKIADDRLFANCKILLKRKQGIEFYWAKTAWALLMYRLVRLGGRFFRHGKS